MVGRQTYLPLGETIQVGLIKRGKVYVGNSGEPDVPDEVKSLYFSQTNQKGFHWRPIGVASKKGREGRVNAAAV